ncbi:MAG: protein kinase, partial [Romboutsia sp.]|nr:protein kinase [Romboutsia sp.]
MIYNHTTIMWWLWNWIYEHLYFKDPLSNYNYKKDRVLGKGRDNDVYSYIDLTTNEKVAIKKVGFVFPPSRFKEALMLKKIKGKHNTFLDYRGSIIEGNYEYIITEIAKGCTLLDLCEVIGIDTIKDIIYKLLEGISTAHEMNIVHGDLKLENILYDKYNRELKIIDWGFAANIGKDGYKNINRVCGTMPYIPPEIFDRIAGHFNDVWS